MGRSIDLSALDPKIMSVLGAELYNAFKYGIENDMIYGKLLDNGVEQDLEEVSATQYYEIGTRRVTKDGRVYRYSKSSGICRSGRGNKFMYKISDGIDWQLLNATSAIGATTITFATGTHAAFTKDQLVGGLVLISDSEWGGTADTNVQNRVIVGNDASLQNAVCTITLDRPLTREVTVSTYAFLMPNPYASIAFNADVVNSIAGVPMTYVSASGKYFWLMTWGKLWLAPQADDVGKINSARQVVFRQDGSLAIHDYANALEGMQQHAGFIIDDNTGANGGTFFELQISP